MCSVLFRLRYSENPSHDSFRRYRGNFPLYRLKPCVNLFVARETPMRSLSCFASWMVTNICGASLCSSGLLMCSRASCLGDPFCSVWRCCSPEVMEASAPTKKKSPAKRRFTPLVSPGKMGTICKGVLPSNTKKATSWAVRVFEEWRRERNATTTSEQCPLELLEKPAFA